MEPVLGGRDDAYRGEVAIHASKAAMEPVLGGRDDGSRRGITRTS